jgi:hypothetical protein
MRASREFRAGSTERLRGRRTSSAQPPRFSLRPRYVSVLPSRRFCFAAPFLTVTTVVTVLSPPVSPAGNGTSRLPDGLAHSATSPKRPTRGRAAR